jgi:hypothetical protein
MKTVKNIKKNRNENIKTIRNTAHYIVGFVFLYCIGNATYVNDFRLFEKIFGSTIIGLIFGGTIGAFWEFINEYYFKIKHDENDVKRTAIGGAFGCMLACFYTDLYFITFWLFYTCIALIIVDLIRAIKNKNN